MAINVVPAQAPSENSGAQSARDRAIAKMMSANPSPGQVAEMPPEVMQAAADANQSPETPPVEGQPDSVEGSPAEAPKEETKAKEEPLSTQYAILARKEKALRAKVQAQEQSIKAKEAAIQAREDAIKAKESEYATGYIPKSRLTESPWEVLNEAGLSYDQLTELALNAPQQDPATKAAIAKLEAKLEAQAQMVEEAKQSQVNQQKQAYQQAVTQIRNEAKTLVASDPAYETIKEMGAVGEVVELIEQTFKSDGVLLSVEEAAREVEEHLIEEAMKIYKIKKIQQRFTPPAKQEAPKQQATPQQPQQMKTLTNSIGSAKKLSAKERAILAFKGELKS